MCVCVCVCVCVLCVCVCVQVKFIVSYMIIAIQKGSLNVSN